MNETPLELSVEEAASLLREGNTLRLIDVRTQGEWDIARIEGATLLDEDSVRELVERGDRNQHLVVYCHHGVRSLNATAWLRAQGFNNAQSMKGGIDAWAKRIDPSVPMY